MVFPKGKLHIASLGNPRGVFKGLRQIGKERVHLLLALEIELLGLKPHPVLVIHCLSHLDAQQYILQFGVLFA